MASPRSRTIRWILLSILIISTFILASFNATLKYIVDQRRDYHENKQLAQARIEQEKAAWAQAGTETKEEASSHNSEAEEHHHNRMRQEHVEAYEKANPGKKYSDLKSSSSSNNKHQTITQGDQLKEQVSNKQREQHLHHLTEQEEELALQLKIQAEEEKQRQRENPTLGKFKTTIRPLDGFVELGGIDIDIDIQRPAVQSHSRQSNVHSTPHSPYTNNNSTKSLLADVHYAKALRMLSSPFDQLHNGGNAIPHPVYTGEYDQEIGVHATGGRGESFVKMQDQLQSKRRYKQKRLKYKRRSMNGGKNNKRNRKQTIMRPARHQLNKQKKKKKGNGGKITSTAGYIELDDEEDDDDPDDMMESNNAHSSSSAWELPEDEPIANVLLEFLHEWYLDTIDWLYESVGFDLDEYYDDYGGGDGGDPGAAAATTRNGESTNQEGGGGTTLWSSRNEEDVFAWRDTKVGSQLVWISSKIASLWSRQQNYAAKDERSSKKKTVFTDSSTSPLEDGKSQQKDKDGEATTTAAALLSNQDELAREGLFHLEKAAELGHSEAQRMIANSLASGILPISDHSLMHRLAQHEYSTSQDPNKNWTSTLLSSVVQVPDDFSSGGSQLSRAIMLWHVSAMDGNVESAMALGYRHLYSATGGSTLVQDLVDDKFISTGYHPVHGGVMQQTGGGSNSGKRDNKDVHATTTTSASTSISHYGVLGTCPTAMAYYEAAANGILDELESGPTKGKVNPPMDEHRLAEIYTHGGASVSLESYNKPDELEEALQYYRMLASRNRSPEPDLVASFTIANFYYNGWRGVKQDLRLALKYYEICGDYNHWEGGGQAGLMNVWGIGMTPEERDLGKAYAYFQQGTPGGLDGCADRLKKMKRQNQKKDGGDGEERVAVCDRHSVAGMGLLNLLGVEGLVDRNPNMARRWFEHGKEMGDAESGFNYAMLRLGWMSTELDDLPWNKSEENDAAPSSSKPPSAGASTPLPGSTGDHQQQQQHHRKKKTAFDQNYLVYRAASSSETFDEYSGPSASDYNVGLQELLRAANKGHIQARHRLAMLYATGATIPKKRGRPSKTVTQSCINALRWYKVVADGGHTVSRRNRAAWKQYGAGDYDSSLRNYLSTAETGSEVGQVNAAFLLEQGYCFGMTRSDCTRASVRLWRAAARQGNLEACLRVGDFYYYGRMKKSEGLRGATPSVYKDSGSDGETATVYDREEYLSSLEAKAFYFIPGPYRWTRYVLYPEELFDLASKWLVRTAQTLQQYVSTKTPAELLSDDATVEVETSSTQCSRDTEAEGMCKPEWADEAAEKSTEIDKEDYDHMAIAAQYYRKAAEEHKSARANFNLGFMHEWGLGLTQDFPLAKRHYDLAGENANMAAAIALWAMNIHQKAVKLGMIVKEYAKENNWIIEDEIIATVTETTAPKTSASLEPQQSKTKELPNAVVHTASDLRKKKQQEDLRKEKQQEQGLRMNKENKKKKQTFNADDFIANEDLINDMTLMPERQSQGHFPEMFEKGFTQLPWEQEGWTIEKTPVDAPFKSTYSAYTCKERISGTKIASLKLPMNSHSGGRICFNLYADVGMPWEDLRFSLDREERGDAYKLVRDGGDFQFSTGTTWSKGSWVDYCFEVPPGKHTLEWLMAWPEYYDKFYATEKMSQALESARKSSDQPTGHVLLDNIRFYPFVYDNFETGDFSLQKWRQFGDGALWQVAAKETPFGKFAAYATPTTDNPSGSSSLELAVDLGYTGALLTFKVKTSLLRGRGNDCVWFTIDREEIRPWFGGYAGPHDGGWWHYTHHISEGKHIVSWIAQFSGDDPEASVWIDDIKFYSRETHYAIKGGVGVRDLGWTGREKAQL